MEGKIEFTFGVDENENATTKIDASLKHVGILDKFCAMRAMEKALHVSEDEFEFYKLSREIVIRGEKQVEKKQENIDTSVLNRLLRSLGKSEEEEDN